MNPRIARLWAIILMAGTATLALLNPGRALALILAVSAIGVLLVQIYRRQRRRARRSGLALPPGPQLPAYLHGDSSQRRWPDRNKPDAMVASWLLVASSVSAALIAVLTATRQAPLHWVPYEPGVEALVLICAAIAGIVYTSTLLDWYLILPQLSGLVDSPPCRSSSNQKWRAVARVMYANRWTSIIACMCCGAAIIGAGIYFFVFSALRVDVGGAVERATSIVTAIISLVLIVITVGSRLKLHLFVDPILNPAMGIGEVVKSRADAGTQNAGRSWFPLARGGGRQLYYVVDVSTQGTKVKRIHDKLTYGGEPFAPNKGEIIKYEDVMEPVRFEGCAEKCSGVNWYCDNNTRIDRYRG